jgi:hypothetical protein
VRRHSPSGLPAAFTALLAVLFSSGCRIQESVNENHSVAFVVYDAGETLSFLPVAGRIRDRGLEVRWIPLTPWTADLLRANGEEFLRLPDGIREMAHLEARDARTDMAYWNRTLAARPPDVAVSGVVSMAQAQLGRSLRDSGIRTRGFHDGFQPPRPGSIAVQAASAFEELWVPTARVRDEFLAMGIPAVLAGQPTLEAWRRASAEVDEAEVRRLLGIGGDDRLLLYAGQYGPGYRETLESFLDAVRPILEADPFLHLVVSHHPRTEGEVEREELARAGLRRAIMAPEEMPTMELAVAAEVVLTWASTVGVQAAFMGKPVVYYSPPADFDTYLVDQGAASRADAGTLSQTVTAILESQRSPESIREILVDSGYVVDADSVVAELIVEAIGG